MFYKSIFAITTAFCVQASAMKPGTDMMEYNGVTRLVIRNLPVEIWAGNDVEKSRVKLRFDSEDEAIPKYLEGMDFTFQDGVLTLTGSSSSSSSTSEVPSEAKSELSRSLFGSVSSLTVGSYVAPGQVSINVPPEVKKLLGIAVPPQGAVSSQAPEPKTVSKLPILCLLLPDCIPIDICLSEGRILLANMQAKVTATLSGTAKLEIDNLLNDAEIKASDTSQVTVDVLKGQKVDIETSGSGSVNVKSGEVQNLKCYSRKKSTITFGGKAKDANPRAFGSSKIEIKEVTGELKKPNSGDGQVLVLNRQ